MRLPIPRSEGAAVAPVAGDEPAGWRRALALLWVGQVVSHLGDALFLVGSFFLALEVTGSKSASGLLVAMNFLPALALGLVAGAFVDRHDRRRVMIAADLLRAAAVGAIPALYLTGNLGAVALAAAMFGLASGSTLFNPALKSLLPELAPVPRLHAAVSVFQISEYAALVAGPAVAALALPRLGMIHLFTVDALTFLFSALCVWAVPARPRAAALRVTRAAGGLWRAIGREVAQGVRAVGARPVLRWVLILTALDNLAIMGLAHVGTPLLVKEGLGLGAEAYARTQTAFFLGLATSSALCWLLARRAPKGPLILVGIVLDGLTFLPLAFCSTLGQLQLAMFVHALAIPLIIIPRTVLIQQTVPGPLHGRTFALLNVTVFGMTAISAALVGVAAEAMAPQRLFLALGSVGALAGLAGLLIAPLRRTR